MPTLSVIIIAQNEAHNILECVKSCSFADEVLVLDSGSSDGTPILARQAGARVIETDWPGFGLQKQRALNLAQSEWILCIDADERVPQSLRAEIEKAIQSPGVNGYRIPRLSSFCGQFIYHSGWRPDYTLRLAKRKLAGFSDHLVHEHMKVEGKVADLTNDLIHFSYIDLGDVLSKLERYSTASAQDMVRRNKAPTNMFGALLHGMWAFIRTFVIRAGFLDGSAGLMLAIYNGECTYYKYLKHREITFKQQKASNP